MPALPLSSRHHFIQVRAITLSLSGQAGWLLLAATVISVAYELWRATARAGLSAHDSKAKWVQGLPIYVVATVVSALLIIGWEWAPLAGMVVAGGSFLTSVFWYGPTVLCRRDPELIDWIEDRVFTALVGIVFILTLYELLGVDLR